jgi:hypothetical protein
MSDLQLSLLVIGAVVVAAVYLYNWLQERSYRHRMSQAFGAGHDDVLLKAGVESALADGRLEPQLVPAESAQDEGRPEPARAGSGANNTADGFDDTLDYLAEIEVDAPIPEPIISELTSKIAACGKPVHVAGLDAQNGEWADLARGQGGRFRGLRLSLQLVNRAGAVNATQLALFCDAVRASADRLATSASCPDAQAALKHARDLDAFCADVDVAVGVNIIAAESASFPGTRIRAAAEAAGFKLEPDGVFHYRNEQRQTLFTLDNHEPAPFLPESIKGLNTGGVTFLMDVPRVANGASVLDHMLEIAGGIAVSLGGQLVDDNRAPLTETGLARIKEQVRTIHARMDLHGVPAGSARALRLFS